MQTVLAQRCRKCGKVFHDQANLATIEEWGLCNKDNVDNDRREHVLADVLNDQRADDQAEAVA